MTTQYRNVICCMEESEPALAALARAREVSAGRLTLLHVLALPMIYTFPVFGYVPDQPELRSHVEEWIAGLAAHGEDGIVIDGHPPSAACDYADAHGADLIVAARHRGFVERVLLGSFAGYLAQHAPCDVLLVRP